MYDEAIQNCRRALQMEPGFPTALVFFVTACLNKGTPGPAIAELSRIAGTSQIFDAWLGVAHAVAGDTSEA